MEWRMPEEVSGWLSEDEGKALAALAAGKTVLEIGSYEGRSTICMAQAALGVCAVDPFDGRATTSPQNTYATFKGNLAKYGVSDRVTIHVGTSKQIVPDLAERFDLVLIDGDHSTNAVLEDARLALRKLKRGGLLCFHDYRRPGDEAVTFAVDTIIGLGGKLVALHDTVAVMDVSGLPVPPWKLPPFVAIAMPCYPGRNPVAGARDAFNRPSARGVNRLPLSDGTSATPYSFNMNWCAALNAKKAYPISDWAMIHDDVCPEGPWLDVLMDERDRTGADVVAAAIPIKNGKGLTSTAVDYPGYEWKPRKLSMTELFELPETFGAEDVPWREPGACLLPNTGLWVCKFDDWCEKICFQFQDRIVKTKNGDFQPQFIPEDWDFGRQLAQLGLKVMVTRKVKLYHERKEFHNHSQWGGQTKDEEFFTFHEQRK